MKVKTKSNNKKHKAAVERNRLNPQLSLVPTTKDNPRRKGSFGYKSFAAILKATNGGRRPVKVADAQEVARAKDIRWDIAHGFLKVVKKAS